jgi:hypothetical protein
MVKVETSGKLERGLTEKDIEVPEGCPFRDKDTVSLNPAMDRTVRS